MAAFVLVHGGCHGPDCWNGVAARLRARGHSVDAVALPGHGHGVPRAGLAEGIAATVEAVEAAGESVILVGHSLGGLSISGAAEQAPGAIRRLVYLTALLPVDGESGADFSRFEDFRGSEGSFLYDGGEWAGVRPERAHDLFYADCAPDVARRAVAALCPTDTDYLTTPVALGAAFAGVAKTYIVCLKDAAIGVGAQRAMIAAHPGIDVVEIDSGHSPFLSMPDDLGDVLEMLAGARRRYAEVRAELDAPVDRLWPEIARFDGVERWIAGVDACGIEGQGIGAVRTLTLGERTVRERLVDLDASRYEIASDILEPHGLPAADVRGYIRLTALPGGGTQIAWSSEARDFRTSPDVLGQRIEAFYVASIEGLKTLLAR